jgi:hypothetical protein
MVIRNVYVRPSTEAVIGEEFEINHMRNAISNRSSGRGISNSRVPNKQRNGQVRRCEINSPRKFRFSEISFLVQFVREPSMPEAK